MTKERLDAAPPPLLYEMMRSFATLARTLNLSQAVEQLGSTRQTVRRHIASLEDAMGGMLFSNEDRRYQLTELGQQTLPEAQDILIRGSLWLGGQSFHTGGLPAYQLQLPNGDAFYQHQKSIGSIWKSDRNLLSAAVRYWAKSKGQLNSEDFAPVRDYVMIYRNSPNGWICVELGEKSSYVSWFGRENAQSSVGRVLGDMPGGDEFARLLNKPFHDVELEGGMRLDHIHTRIPRTATGATTPISYERLLLGGSFPDGSFALISVVDRHNGIDIDIPQEQQMPAELEMPNPDDI